MSSEHQETIEAIEELLEKQEEREDRRMNKSEPGGWEKHLSSIAQAIAVGLLLWIGNEGLEQGKTQVEMAGKIDLLTFQMAVMKEGLDKATVGRYTVTDADRDRKHINEKIESLERRIDHLESTGITHLGGVE